MKLTYGLQIYLLDVNLRNDTVVDKLDGSN